MNAINKNLIKIKTVAVYCGSHTPPDPHYAEAAVDLANFMALHEMTLVYGGSDVGIMKILADAMLKCGGKVVGVFVEGLPMEIIHKNLTETVTAATLADRKAEMLRRADAVIALPGGFGTWDELFDALALRKKKKGGHKAPVGVLNVNGYFDHLLEFIRHSIETGFTSRRSAKLLKSASTPEALFHQLAGSVV